MLLSRLSKSLVRSTSAILLGASFGRLTVTHGFIVNTKPFQITAFATAPPMSNLAAISDSAVRHVDQESLPSWMLAERTRYLTENSDEKETGKCVVYWMQRDVRTQDNWALFYANHLAQKSEVPLKVVYCLPPPPPASNDDDLPSKIMVTSPVTERYGEFLLGGLESVQMELRKKEVPLHIVMPASPDKCGESVLEWLDQCQPRMVVCDFSPIRQFREMLEDQAAPLLATRSVPLVQVDAHNVVPVWHAAPKRQVGARTLRPKLNKLVPTFLTEFPEKAFQGNKHASAKPTLPKFDRETYKSFLQWDDSVKSVAWAQPGNKNAMKQFDSFLDIGLRNFNELRNDPNQKDICSKLSPWLNHGHISFQFLARHVKKLNKYAQGTAAYIEEGLVRRELSDNYLYYAPDNYDALEGAAGWAQETLQNHSLDEREWLFSLSELEKGETHDDLWNAAEMQLVEEGKLHGFLRMYWAKKILEWTESPEIALRTAQYLNDKYALDGNDPNGFVGVGWSIMGIHDMGWKERPIFGKIRYMNYAGCRRKFKVDEFVNKYKGAASNAIKAAEKYGKPRETGGRKVPAKKSTKSAAAAPKKKAPAVKGATVSGIKRKTAPSNSEEAFAGKKTVIKVLKKRKVKVGKKKKDT